MPKDHTPEETNIILQQWQTCVSSAETVSQRRDVINGIFVTLSLAIMTATTAFMDWRAYPLLLVGVVISIAWLLYLSSLRKLNQAKYAIINNYESLLPVKPFSQEWEQLSSDPKYLKGTFIEKILPISFLVLYAILFVLVLVAL